MRFRWTQAEDAVLRTNWPRGGMAAVRGLLPERSEAAIRRRVHDLGIHVAHDAVIRKPPAARGYDYSSREIAFWLATHLFSGRPRVPETRSIKAHWNISRATAYRWRRWALDKLEQMRACTGAQPSEGADARHVH